MVTWISFIEIIIGSNCKWFRLYREESGLIIATNKC